MRFVRRHPWVVLIAALLATAGIYSWVGSHLAWRRALAAAGFLDELTPPGAGDRVLIIAPHPDDEALGCAGLIQQALSRGAQVRVVLMTNGDASELSVIFAERELPRAPSAFLELGRKRQLESISALSLLGVPQADVYFLGYPNNGLLQLWRPEHWPRSDPYLSPYTHASSVAYKRAVTPGASYCGQQVLNDLVGLLQQFRPTHIFVTHPRDIHPDHWTTYCFTRYALATIAARGGDWVAETNVYGYLVHWPRYPAPRRRAPALDLLPPRELVSDTSRWMSLPLTDRQAARKEKAIRLYRSQAPTFDRLLLSLARRSESFEELPNAAAEPDGALEWAAPTGGPRGLRGAEVTRLSLSVGGDGPQTALVRAAEPAVPRDGYIAVDLRAWDDAGQGQITTVYLLPGGKAVTRRLHSDRAPFTPAAVVQQAGEGQYRVSGALLPPGAVERGAFVTCWGSVRDRIAALAAAALVAPLAQRSDRAR
jgi:LmbE family N-acetylglucosaminyl deacetylase